MLFAVSIGQGEWIIILIVLLLIFGSTQLPKLARSLGSAQKEFRKGIQEAEEDSVAEGNAEEGSAGEGSTAKNSATASQDSPTKT